MAVVPAVAGRVRRALVNEEYRCPRGRLFAGMATTASACIIERRFELAAQLLAGVASGWPRAVTLHAALM